MNATLRILAIASLVVGAQSAFAWGGGGPGVTKVSGAALKAFNVGNVKRAGRIEVGYMDNKLQVGAELPISNLQVLKESVGALRGFGSVKRMATVKMTARNPRGGPDDTSEITLALHLAKGPGFLGVFSPRLVSGAGSTGSQARLWGGITATIAPAAGK